mmetsp:Transcript_24694/g.36399  ORF Transcript_24694/g.36399 Transcript_24694/m.36399 type:complete len:232 (-) Transcript_24694:108-803(-)|eukprot:CAMPEP_0185023480 /NCGR_PEP_ID=MMETSP1103-20130426/6145_1 /TAXON_ID=36769 /ORGANISM="Paraphysomonas bandaiensis, Strain Caron Lab Isolate" /LENGTH=231 /DNA_ID=CAMNT_0027556089 /DNA_START=66 /DNA_END=761 /DNA_ORIENTATION=-
MFLPILLLVPTLALGHYSIYYTNSQSAVSASVTRFAKAPNALQVADIYSRLSGHSPVLSEDTVALPAVDVLSASTAKPVILDLFGGEKLKLESTTVARFPVKADDMAPSAADVQAVLREHNVEVDVKDMEFADSATVEAWVKQQSAPVVILHHEQEISRHTPIRRLAETNTTNSTTPLTEEEISSYQIGLWTGLSMVLLLLTGVCMISTMDVIPDSLLFAKFQSTRGNKSD